MKICTDELRNVSVSRPEVGCDKFYELHDRLEEVCNEYGIGVDDFNSLYDWEMKHGRLFQAYEDAAGRGDEVMPHQKPRNELYEDIIIELLRRLLKKRRHTNFLSNQFDSGYGYGLYLTDSWSGKYNK